MQRHVANGGLPYDDVGKSIIKMSENIAQLRSFSNYVVRNDLMNSDNNPIIERSQEALNNLREQIARLSKQKYYEDYKNSFVAEQEIDLPDSVVEEFKDKFTVKNFKEDIKSVFPILYRLMQENSKVGYEDIVSMTTENEEENIEIREEEDELLKFERWIMTMGEESSITSDDPEQQKQAVKELQELVGEHFPAGVDGTNAIESLKGIIEDPQLFKEIKDQAKEDPDSCVRPLVKDWLEQNAPEVVNELDFGDMVDEPAAGQGGEQTAPEEEPQMAGDDPDEINKKDDEDDLPFKPDDEPMDKDEFGNTIKHKARHLARKGMRQAMDVKELAEFITSFYDKESGTFPKGPEGVCTMVGKKFGEQAEAVARKFVERMAPHQEQGAEQMQELARIRELSGMRNQQGVDEGSDTVDSIKAKIAELEDEQGENEFGSYAYDTTDAELQSLYAKLDKAKKGMSEGALDELHSDLNDKFNELAPKIEKYKDAQGAKNLYNELMSIAKEHGSEREFERMLDNARHHAHMEYDMNPGGFENWFWHLPLGDNLKDDVSPELEDIRRLSGIAQGIGY